MAILKRYSRGSCFLSCLIGQLRCPGLLAIAWISIGTALIVQSAFAVSDVETEREYAVKAAFLYHFTQFIEWPEEISNAYHTPFRIGVVHPNPFGDSLERIAIGQQIGSRPIEIIYLDKIADMQSAAPIHILFVPEALGNRGARKAIEHTAGTQVLVVGEDLSFLELGGMISLVRQQGRVTIHINRDALKGGGLDASARLLRIATIMDSYPSP